jgi:hypothetical protein
MDRLKQFIDGNREEFDDIELPEGHRKRFCKKLSSHGKLRTLRYFIYAAVAAACVALLFLFRPSVGFSTEEDDPAENVCEIEDVQLYYTMQMNDVLAKIEKAYEQESTPKSAQLMLASRHVQNDVGRFEETVLPFLPCSEEGLYAMNQHYRNSLKSLEIMLEQMENETEND